MAIPLTVDGVTYTYPEQGDTGYASQATLWAQAMTTALATLETFSLSAGFRAHIGTAQTGISTATVVIFNTEDFDNRNGYDPATGIYTVQTGYDGDYVFTASLVLTQVSSTAVQQIRILKNGSVVATAEYSATAVGTGNAALACSCFLPGLVATDTVKVDVAATAGTCSTVVSAGSQFSGRRIPS